MTEIQPTNNRGKIAVYILLGLLLFGSFLFSLSLWKKNSNYSNHSLEQTFEYVNGSLIAHQKTRITINNYFPFINSTYKPILRKKVEVEGETIWERVGNAEKYWEAENITIESLKRIVRYGEEELYPPTTRINPPSLVSWITTRMTESEITIDWKYVYSEDRYTSPEKRVYYTADIEEHEFFTFISTLGSAVPFSIVFFSMFFVATGYTFSRSLVTEFNVKKAYRYLTKELKITANTPDSITYAASLKELNYFPHQLGYLRRFLLSLIFGPSVLFFKTRITSWYKQHQKDSIYFKKTNVSKELEEYIKKSNSKLSDFVPELASILTGITFLATVGVSFAWNVGAALPFVYSFGLVYFFLNIGSSFHLVGRSYKDLALNFFIMLIAFLIILSPTILSLLRWG